MSQLHDFTTAPCPFDEVPRRIEAWLREHDGTIALRLSLRELRIERDVEVHLRPAPDYPGYHNLDVTWAPKDGGPYPTFQGTISIADEGGGWSRIDLDGGYRPPLGILGAAFDAMLGHRIAEAVAANLLAEIRRLLAAAGAHRAPESQTR